MTKNVLMLLIILISVFSLSPGDRRWHSRNR